MIPLQIYPQKFDSSTLERMQETVLSCSEVLNYQATQGVFANQGTVANLIHWEWDDPAAEYLRDTLNAALLPIIGPFVSIRSHILDSRLPWDVHNDYAIDCRPNDLVPYCVVMIPLETTPAKTIFFNQSAEYKDFSHYKETNPPIPDHVPHEQWNGMLSHCWVKDRFWLNIDRVYDWQQGDLVIFDRRQWHASDDYRNRIQSKRAILLFTSYP